MVNSTSCLLQSRTQSRIKKTPDFSGDNLCWFDGVAQRNGTLCGAGGIIKTSGMTSYRWTLNCGQGSNTREKLLGVWACLTLEQHLNLECLHVLGDSKIVIDWINHSNKLQVTSLLGWNIYREENMEADALSKYALQVPEGRIFYNKWQDGHEGPPTIFTTLSLKTFPGTVFSFLFLVLLLAPMHLGHCAETFLYTG
jgi:ribonuclease HI